MSVPALEVVDHVAGMHCGFTAQPAELAGCGPPPRTSTLFCAALGAAPSSNMLPPSNNSSFLIAFFSSRLSAGSPAETKQPVMLVWYFGLLHPMEVQTRACALSTKRALRKALPRRHDRA